MTPDLFNLPDDAPFDPNVVKEVQENLKQVTTGMMAGRMQMSQLLAQSAAEGGPSSVNEAILNLMDSLNIGIRTLATGVGVKRKLLHRMILGEVELTQEVMDKITEFFKKRAPHLF